MYIQSISSWNEARHFIWHFHFEMELMQKGRGICLRPWMRWAQERKEKKLLAFTKNKWKRNMLLNGRDERKKRQWYLKWIHWELNKQWEKALCMRSHFYNDFTIDKRIIVFFIKLFSILITIEIRFSHSIFCLNKNDFRFGKKQHIPLENVNRDLFGNGRHDSITAYSILICLRICTSKLPA